MSEGSRDHKRVPLCSFCGADAGDSMLVRGADDSHICEGCVGECAEIIRDHQAKREKKAGKPALTPRAIKAHLDQFVIGQDRAKRLMSIGIYNHFKRIQGFDTGGVEVQKSNMMLVGPTGSGKTLMVRTLAKLLKVPVAIADATSLTQAGYVGDDVESVLTRLVQAAGGDIALAQKGICFVDEIDKIAKVANDRGRDVSGEGVQQGLLKIVEGGLVAINPEGPKKLANTATAWIDTTNILFIGGGAFSGLFEGKGKRKLGFEQEDPEASKGVTSQDLVKYGMMPELIGRMPIIAQLDALSVDDMVRVLSKTKNCLVDQYAALLKMDGVNLEFGEDFLRGLAERAIDEGTGARGLRALIEKALEGPMFDGPDMEGKEVKVGAEALAGLDA